MKTADNTPTLRTQIDAHQCRLSQAEIDRLEAELQEVAPLVQNFPISDAHVLIEHNQRSNDYSVKVSLVLPGATLVGHDHDQVWHAAFERCLDGLVENVRAYKDELGQVPERQKQEKGTRQEVLPDVDPDPAALEAAAGAEDYTAFRLAIYGFEEPLRKRAGRWVERYPDFQARLGKGLEIADLVEGVLVRAFESYDQRPREIRFGDWLETLLDPTIKALLRHQDEELEHLNLLRAAVQAEAGPGAV
jgi:ribosome-associated translation inhibitor RaiA